MTNRHHFPGESFDPVHSVGLFLLGTAYYLLGVLISIVWVGGFTAAAVIRYRGGTAEEVLRGAEAFGVTWFWRVVSILVGRADRILEALYHFLVAYQLVAFLSFLALGTCILYPAVRLVLGSTFRELVQSVANDLRVLPGRIYRFSKLVLVCVLTLALSAPCFVVGISFLVLVGLVAINFFLEQKPLIEAWQVSVPVAVDVLVSAFAGLWEFTCFLPGFACRNPVIACSTAVVIFVPMMAQMSFHVDDL